MLTKFNWHHLIADQEYREKLLRMVKREVSAFAVVRVITVQYASNDSPK